MKVDGRCHCGLITYVAEVEPDKVEICHCTDCQTMSGSAFRIVVPAEPGTFKLQSGKLKTYVKTAESGNRRVQAFCPECGTSIYSTAVAEGPQTIGLRVGAIVQRSQFPPKIQYWTPALGDGHRGTSIRREGMSVALTVLRTASAHPRS